MLLEVCTSAVEELVRVVMPTSVDDIATSELVTCKRLDSTVDKLSAGRCSSVKLEGVAPSKSRRLVVEVSALLPLVVMEVRSGPELDRVGKGEDDKVDLGSDSAVDTAMLVRV